MTLFFHVIIKRINNVFTLAYCGQNVSVTSPDYQMTDYNRKIVTNDLQKAPFSQSEIRPVILENK